MSGRKHRYTMVALEIFLMVFFKEYKLHNLLYIIHGSA